MRLICTFFSLLLLSHTAYSQKLTGIWRGYFSSSDGVYREGAKEEMYKYEIQIDQQSNNGVKGVTFSYKSTIFYGKAELQGIYTATSKSLLLKETKLIDLKVAGQSEPCLMTCYLDYSKVGKMEFLQGTFISINSKDKSDCGQGKVYLERVTTSDFKKEDFLQKIKDIDSAIPNRPANPDKSKPTVKTPPPPKNNDKPSLVMPLNPTAGNTKPKEKTKPVVKDEGSKLQPPHVDRTPEQSVESPKKDSPIAKKTETLVHKASIPRVLLERENNLVATIIVDQEDVQIDFYDNGTIDHDTISIYHNNELVVNKNQLSYSPITLTFKCSKTDNHHEIIVVAENLGDIPPNTAVMVINARGKKRQEVFIASTEQRNAKVIIEYRPKE